MTSGRPRTLSKSDFSLARSCDAKLWFRENGFQDNREFNDYLQLLAHGGYMVEALATAKYPDGILMEYGSDTKAAFRTTVEHLSRDRVTLFQGTLLWKRRLARVDIIHKHDDTIRLIEVKAKSFDGARHAASLTEGGKGEFRSSRKPHGILSKWSEKLEDVTYQTLMLEGLFPHLKVEPWLALIDSSKRSTLDDVPGLFRILRQTGKDGRERLHSAEFAGTREQLNALDLITEVFVGDEVNILRDDVEEAANRFESILDADFDLSFASRGAQCKDCEFRGDKPGNGDGFGMCWGHMATTTPHMLELFSIGTVKRDKVAVVEQLVSAGKSSLFDIPDDCLCKADGSVGPVAARQRRQIEYAKSGATWLSTELRSQIESLRWPVHFIDFEVTRLALPYHARMRPYGQVTFQWSCHTVTSPGAQPSHTEWLNLEYSWPNKVFLETLRAAIGDIGTVVTWSPFEESRMKETLRELAQFDAEDADLAAWAMNVVDSRIVDIHDWAKQHYYHPAMGGRTSLKVVMDALWKSDDLMRSQFQAWTGLTAAVEEDPYHALPAIEINGSQQDVREGTGAMRAYEAMMYGVEKDDAVARSAWGDLLRQYCRLDTLSMVLVFEHWRRQTGVNDVACRSDHSF